MKYSFFMVCIGLFCLKGNAQKGKYDSTMKIGKVGYKVVCNNKNIDKNQLTISLLGFEENRNDIELDVKGKVLAAEVDDVNNDGFPDLLLYIFTDAEKRKGTVFAIASDNNKSILPIIFPDITDDEKLKVGYDGGDVFRLLNGRLLRKFPIYNTADSATTEKKNTIGVRQIIYKVVAAERGTFKFKVDRSFDTAKQ
ncbi:MAG TPA: hypothetical protein PLW32_01960 [Chitinophagaceae bacterium]|jgi:hypothetical protein|nr:hypothetical protein [Chitinophagaceae bacterium]HPH22621.1 hypothetical protein [Chitinophagaceae bacterium]